MREFPARKVLSRVMMLVALAALLLAIVCFEPLDGHHSPRSAETTTVAAPQDHGCATDTDPDCAKLARHVSASPTIAPAILPAVTGDLTGADHCRGTASTTAAFPPCDVAREFLNVWVI